MRRSVWVGIAIMMFAVGAVSRTDASMITYTDLTSWSTAVGAFGTEDLSGFATDTSFRNTTVNLAGGMSVTGTTGSNGAQSQKIDVFPFEFSDVSQGTSNIIGDLQGSNQFIKFTFATPLTAWGIDTKGIGDAAGLAKDTNIKVFNSSNVLLGTIHTSSDDSFMQEQFYGFRLNAGESAAYLTIVNSSDAIDVFGIDNIRYTAAGPAVTPEPMTIALVGSGLLAAAARRRRRHRS